MGGHTLKRLTLVFVVLLFGTVTAEASYTL